MFGRARKMGGYRRLTNLLDGVGRGMTVFDQNNNTYTHVGTADVLQQMQIDPNGNVFALNDRTPGTFVSDANNLWQFSTAYDTGNTANLLLAHAAPNAADISSDTATNIYYGNVTAATALTATAFTATSGGVVASGPYTWAYGSNGVVEWSPPNDPAGYGNTGSGTAAICSAKIVRAMPLRAGSGSGPTTLFWSLNSLERATFVGGTAIFNFDTISPESSILSAASVIEYNGIYFWVGVDSFLMFNGVVRELPNDMNLNDFFDNLNYTYRQRVFAVKFPKFGEIWWCYPRGSATECTHAVIYNVRENTWYDTELPNGGRSCGQYAQVFRSPLMCGVADPVTADFKLWQHEFGVDSIDGTDVLAIRSFFETSEFGGPDGAGPNAGGSNMSVEVSLIEPDFVQTGPMLLTLYGRTNCRSVVRTSDQITFVAPNTPTGYVATPEEELNQLRWDMRYTRFRWESNVQGGDYWEGKVVAHFKPTSERLRS